MSNGLHPYNECAGCDHGIVEGVACEQCPHEAAVHERNAFKNAHPQRSYEALADMMADPDDPDSGSVIRGIE